MKFYITLAICLICIAMEIRHLFVFKKMYDKLASGGSITGSVHINNDGIKSRVTIHIPWAIMSDAFYWLLLVILIFSHPAGLLIFFIMIIMSFVSSMLMMYGTAHNSKGIFFTTAVSDAVLSIIVFVALAISMVR